MLVGPITGVPLCMIADCQTLDIPGYVTYKFMDMYGYDQAWVAGGMYEAWYACEQDITCKVSAAGW